MRLREMLATAVGAAERNPAAAPMIYRQTAEALRKAARDKKNSRMARRLDALAADLSQAAATPRPVTVSDFTDLLEEAAQAFEETGHDPMDQIARQRELHDERTPDDLSVSIAPKSFNRDATLGRQVQLKWAPTEEETKVGIVQSQTLAFWQGVKREAQAVTVDVAPIPAAGGTAFNGAAPGPPSRMTRPYGKVEYGSDGNRCDAQFDIHFGTRFTVVCNYISVSAGMAPPPEGYVSGITTVGASIGCFAAPSAAPVTFTHYIDDLLDAAVDEFRRPLRAIALLPPQSNASGGSIILSFWPEYGSAPIYQITYPTGTLGASPIPLSNDVASIKLQNTTGIQANFRLVFQLAL